MKILVIRFSAIGDVLQFLSVIGALRLRFPHAEIHWLTRADFASLISGHPGLTKIWTVDRSLGRRSLMETIRKLREQEFTHIYDGHNNIRSRIVCAFLNGLFGWRVWTGRHCFIRRGKYRLKRILLFYFRINLYPKPFVGQWSLLEPLDQWGVSLNLPPVPQLFLPSSAMETAKSALLREEGKLPWVALAPSASYELKRWPIKHWCELVQRFSSARFVILGGPEDKFVEEIRQAAPDRCLNLAGRLSLIESAAIVPLCKALVSNDTGMMHVAEQLGRPCIALMGPAPYGFPGRASTLVKERDLKCRPCSKHGEKPCRNKIHQQCLVDISPVEVAADLQKIMKAEA
jgi:lipopolysaccharide heptosyltransferase II